MVGPVDISFQNLTVSVYDKAQGERKTILHNVSGVARSGRLLALMGASGAGKTTLLDVLAGNTLNSRTMAVEGEVLVNGTPRRIKEFNSIASYVQQRDVLLPSATVREAITTSAALKLPYTMSQEEKDARVNKILKELDLEGCADTLIGDEFLGMKGISGGQKRRVSVGIELIKDPKVLFLDEPTSGLDSEMALSCMEALVNLARRGRTVICTIHQPNSDITALFDDFMLLSGGHVVYFGPWEGAVTHFTQMGFPCPAYRNPTDYFLSVVRDPLTAEKLWSAHAKGTAPLALPSNTTTTDLESDRDTHKDTQMGTGERLAAADISTPSWYQVCVLSRRRVRDWLRNPTMLGSELVQYLFIALFVGLMYHGTFFDNTTEGVNNRISCIWFAFTVMSFTPSYTTCTNWDKERQLLKRELHQRVYSVFTAHVARTLVLLPFQALQCLLFVCIMYFFAGFQATVGKFFIFLFTLWIFQITSESVGLLCAMITSSVTMAVVLLTFILLIVLAFSGFLVSQLPVYLRWLQHVSYFTYAYVGLTRNEFEGLYLTGPDGTPVPGMSVVPAAATNDFSLWGNIGILGAQCVGLELLKVVGMHVGYHFGFL